MVGPEANSTEAIHKGKFPVVGWLDKVIFPMDLESIEATNADKLLRAVVHRTFSVPHIQSLFLTAHFLRFNLIYIFLLLLQALMC